MKLSLTARRCASAAAIVIAGAALLTACGGNSNPSPIAIATAPASVPLLASASASTSQPVAATAQSVAVPSVGGASGTFALPAAVSLPPSTTLSLTAMTSAPPASANVISLASSGRSILDASTSQITTLVYELFGFSNPTGTSISFPSFPALTFTLPAFYTLATGGDYYVAYYNGSNWQRPVTAPGTVNGQTISFAAPAGAPTYLAGVTYGFALYYQPFAAPTPAPVNTSTPSPAPSAAPSSAPTAAPTPGDISANPPSLDFGNIGTSFAQTITLSQINGSTTTFTMPQTPCTGIANVTGNSPTFTVAPVAVGHCTLVATGANNRTLNVNVTVTTTSVTAQ